MSIESILVIKPSSLGDVVHTLPAVSLVRRHWPAARLRWLVNPEWAPLLQGNPDIDEVILFPRKELGSNPLKGFRWIRQTAKRYASDLVLDFQGLLRSALVGRMCARQTFIGLSDAREGARLFYSTLAETGRKHAVERYLDLIDHAGVDIGGPLRWNLPGGDRPNAEGLDAPFVLLHPFSRGAGKSLSVKEVQQFCETLGFPVVLAGRTEEDVPEFRDAPVVNLLNRTSIAQLIWLVRHARFVVSVDSGPMHIAAAITPNLISIHTWSDPALVGPYRPEAWVWKERTLFQMQDLGKIAGKHQTVPDIESVAAFVKERI